MTYLTAFLAAIILHVAITARPACAQESRDADTLTERQYFSIDLYQLPYSYPDLDRGLEEAGFAPLGSLGGVFPTRSLGFVISLPVFSEFSLYGTFRIATGRGGSRAIRDTISGPRPADVTTSTGLDELALTAGLEREIELAEWVSIAPRIGIHERMGILSLEFPGWDGFAVTPESMLRGEADRVRSLLAIGIGIDLGVDLRLAAFTITLDEGRMLNELSAVIRAGYLLDLARSLSRPIGAMEDFNGSRFYLSLGIGSQRTERYCPCTEAR